MSFDYTNEDPQRVVLDYPSTIAFRVSPEIETEVRSFAQRHADALGKTVDVYADDAVTYLFAATPAP